LDPLSLPDALPISSPDDPPRFPPITYADYLTWWYDANYNAAVQKD
jgi:hypothetical protein